MPFFKAEKKAVNAGEVSSPDDEQEDEDESSHPLG